MTAAADPIIESESPKPKKGLFGKIKKNDTTPTTTPEKKLERQDSASSKGSTSGGKWFGGEKKKPRAEYQAEIDELKLQLAQANLELDTVNQKYQALHKWARSAPL